MHHYKIVKGSSGSFLCPPGHPHHLWTLEGYESTRHRNPFSIGPLDGALADDFDGSDAIKRRVRKIFDEAELILSEAWIREVYGYFRHMYAPENGSRNAADAVSDRTGKTDPARHLAVLCVQEYFPDHTPRLDLIEDPGKGYGSWPCTKCGAKVQYEARFDAHTVVTTRTVPGEGTQWTYGVECPMGGGHTID